MITWKDDNELFAMMKKELYSAVIGDILDKMNVSSTADSANA